MKSVPPNSVVYYKGDLMSVVREQPGKPELKSTPISINQNDWVI